MIKYLGSHAKSNSDSNGIENNNNGNFIQFFSVHLQR